jgi:hypothetical protein
MKCIPNLDWNKKGGKCHLFYCQYRTLRGIVIIILIARRCHRGIGVNRHIFDVKRATRRRIGFVGRKSE